jgi:hypothetical protein
MHAPAAAPTSNSLEQLGAEAKQTARAASPLIEGLGRFGFAAKGVVYLIVGVLAVQAALGQGGQTTDQHGALAKIAEAPFGRVLLAVLVVGLFGHALWKLVLAVLDPDRRGTDARALLGRAVDAGVAVIYVGLALSALQIALGSSGGAGSTQKTQDWTAWLLGQPLGPWLVALGGAGVVGAGLFVLYRAFTSDPCDELRCGQMRVGQRRAIRHLGRAGNAARGVAFLTIGALLVAAGIHADPGKAQGLDGALATLAAQPFGPHLLGLVAAGLAAYGLFALVEARYGRLTIS